jgi:serine protease Do
MPRNHRTATRGEAKRDQSNTSDNQLMTDRSSRLAPSRRRLLSPVLLALGCCLIVIGGAVASELRESPIVKAVQRVREAVVNIRGEKTITTPAGQTGATPDASRRVNGMGTGVLIDARGYIATNFHVVDGVREIFVTTADGKRQVAKLVARDAETDLAIIKIDSSEPLPVIPFGTSSDLMPGETVIAVGNAYGYEHTVTRGIVSALHRAVQVSDAQFYDDLIQTDASINPGNSGGPLLNIDGDVIGINVAVRAGAQGIGFAIPVDKVASVAAGMLASCNADRVWIGTETSTDASRSGKGMTLGRVEPKSPAAEAGLVAGDVITAVDDLKVERPLDFQRAMLDHRAGDLLQLTVRRAKSAKALNISLTLGTHPDRQEFANEPAWDTLGLRLRAIPSEEFRKSHQTRYRGGLAVTAVRPDSPAANGGILPGDVLVGMHIWETTSLDNVAYILRRPEFTKSNSIGFYILRDDKPHRGSFDREDGSVVLSRTSVR